MAKDRPKTEQAEPEIHIVGLMKVSPGRYSVVTGTVARPRIDTTTEPLEYAARSAQVAMLRLVGIVP